MVDQASRTSLRAHLLFLIDQIELSRSESVVTRRVDADELRADIALRGAVIIHLDLMFRSSLVAEEVLQTAERGVLRVAYHPQLSGFPVGVFLAQPTALVVRARAELFDRSAPRWGETDLVMAYAMATSPPRLGAGAQLFRDFLDDCRALDRTPRVVAFSPLTGMRARVIRIVDQRWPETEEALGKASPVVDPAQLRDQLLDLLAAGRLPDEIPEPAGGWLMAESERFAASVEYSVGNFHRSMGAELTGLALRADPDDSDSMWARAYFDYGVP
jgi:hypothetical protein